jgi:hypothetical protein
MGMEVTREDSMFTLIDESTPKDVAARVEHGRVRLSPAAVREALGWDLEGGTLCREGLCVPIPDGVALQDEDGIDLAALARALDRPLALDLEERAACLGAAAHQRGQALGALVAPDFSLPDLDGRVHTLSAQRGRKVLLVVWASW